MNLSIDKGPQKKVECVALFLGARRSGTGATVNCARRLGREIIVIEPITRQIHHEETASPKI